MISPLPEPDRSGFLNTLRQGAMDVWEGLKSKIQTPFGQVTQNPVASPLPEPKPSPAPIPMQEKFSQGFTQYGSDLATSSGQFAKQAQANPIPDPFLPAVLALMETSGGKNQKYAFNPFNWGMQDMPNLDSAIEKVYSGIAKRFPYYQKYLQTGDLYDFFKHYTPDVEGNPKPEELVQRYTELRKLFD